MIIPGSIAILVAPLYLFTSDPFWITVGFGLQGAFGGALYSQLPSYLSERFPTEVRAIASNVDDNADAYLPREDRWGGLGLGRKRHGLGHPVEPVERPVAHEPVPRLNPPV